MIRFSSKVSHLKGASMPQGLRRLPGGSSARRPQINFQVDHAMKLLYEEAKACGHWVTRFCAAGLLMLIENPHLRRDALSRLRDWEDEFADASEAKVRTFVQGCEDAMQAGARGVRPALPTRRGQKKAGRVGGE